MQNRSALFLSPESPYPPVGGGALRTASLLEYLVQHYTVDVIVFRQPGDPDPRSAFPPGKVRRVFVLDLPFHSKSGPARAFRNGIRLLRGRPPLLDRFSGFESAIDGMLDGSSYGVGIVEHFWCAPYLKQLRPRCKKLLIDLANIESVWHQRVAGTSGAAAALVHKRFAAAYRRLETNLLPRYDELLVTSAGDAQAIRALAGQTLITVYPNALPQVAIPETPKQFSIVFSGNLEYQPNISAIRFFRSEIWPILRGRWPGLTWEIVGKNPQAIADMLTGDSTIHLVGPVPDAIAAIARSQIAVVPVLAGSGTRVKILEAWAAATPVVSTTIGAEGLEYAAGEHLLIADTPAHFAEAVSALLGSEHERQRIGRKGRQLYQDNYTWNAAWSRLTI
ncbi:MAG: glycosyltransferase family 4 protein [Bryobacteraceae bacterium]